MAVVGPSSLPTLSQHLKALLFLRWRLGLRGAAASKINAIGTIVGLCLGIPVALALGVGVGWGLSVIPEMWRGALLKAGFLAIWIAWVLAPIVGVRLSDAWDMGKLLVYPISAKRLFTASILGALGDFSTLFVIPSFLAAIGVAFTWGVLAGLVALIAVPLLLFQTLALAQCAALGLSGALKSRKWRDAAMVIGPLIAMSAQFLRYIIKAVDWQALLKNPLYKLGDWLLPPAMAARAIDEAAHQSLWTLPALVLLVASTVLTVAVASTLIGKIYDGEELKLAVKSVEPSESAGGPDRLAFLPPTIVGLARKEWRYFRRDPYFRLMAMNLLYLLVFTAITLFLRQGGKRGDGDGNLSVALQANPEWAIFPVLGGMFLALLSESQMLYNQFGIDGNATVQLFGFPAPRRQFFLGKNLAQAFALVPTNLILGLVLCLLVGQPKLYGMVVAFVLLMLPLVMALGNVFSVFFPHKVALRGAKMAGGGTGFGFLYTLAWLGAGSLALALYAPVGAALLWPYLTHQLPLLAATLPAAALYVALMYVVGLKAAEGFLREREPWVIEKVTRPVEGM